MTNRMANPPESNLSSRVRRRRTKGRNSKNRATC